MKSLANGLMVIVATILGGAFMVVQLWIVIQFVLWLTGGL